MIDNQKLQTIINRVVGSSDEFSMEHRIFNAAIAICISSSIPGMFFMLFQQTWSIAFLLLLTTLAYGYIFYLCRFDNKLQGALMCFCLLQLFNMNFFWLIDYGIKGTTGFLIFVILIMAIFTAEKPKLYIIAMFTDLILMSIFDKQLMAMIDFSIPYNEVTEKVALIVAIAYVTILALLYKQLIRNRMDETFFNVMGELGQHSTKVSETANTLALNSDHLLDFAMQQKTATEQLSVTTEELGATAEQNHHLSNSAITTIHDVAAHVSESQESIQALLKSIDHISRSGEEIQAMNNLINELAYQTNILSLNAMIEASRASDNGGGFKVVSLEVKSLAERSSRAADSINSALEKNVQNVKQTITLADEMQRRFIQVSEAMQPLTEAVQNVSDASHEQNEAIRQIMTGINDIDRAVDENKKLSDLSSKTANELHNNATQLQQVVKMLQDITHEEESS